MADGELGGDNSLLTKMHPAAKFMACRLHSLSMWSSNEAHRSFGKRFREKYH